MIDAQAFIEPLRDLGYGQYAGVPCSFLTPFINYVIDDPALDYVGATSEGEAVGISLGAYLAGRKTVTMCQNSGLGNMVNPLTSLNYPFRVPTLLIVTWRGQPGLKDEPQHELMGKITHQLLETLQIPWRPFPADPDEIPEAIRAAEASMDARQLPFALVMAKGAVAPHELRTRPRAEVLPTRRQHALGLPADERLTRTQALEIILETLHGDEAIVATTGKTGRELFTIADRPNQIYVVGGMGTSSAIGFGIAHAAPQQPVVVLDGDGAALMKMGNMATIGFYGPSNFLQIVLDNEAHDSTGGQSTVASTARFAEIAAANNYRHAYAVDHPEDLRANLRFLREQPGPNLLHVKIRRGSPKDLGRPTVTPAQVKERFMDFLQKRQIT
jgi:phosphonopyruvate decarboxylase